MFFGPLKMRVGVKAGSAGRSSDSSIVVVVVLIFPSTCLISVDPGLVKWSLFYLFGEFFESI